MKNKQKYDKETLSQYDWIQLYRLQRRLLEKKMIPGAIINFCLAITNLFIKNPWLKSSIDIIESALIIWLLVLVVRFNRIDKIMEEK
jgi:hypothetical protein